jgi:hypothetical protein
MGLFPSKDGIKKNASIFILIKVQDCFLIGSIANDLNEQSHAESWFYAAYQLWQSQGKYDEPLIIEIIKRLINSSYMVWNFFYADFIF